MKTNRIFVVRNNNIQSLDNLNLNIQILTHLFRFILMLLFRDSSKVGFSIPSISKLNST